MYVEIMLLEIEKNVLTFQLK